MTGREILATLLRHESKSNTYKFALIRALNDLALEHPLAVTGDVVVPLRRVAERWLVYYWPFVGERPVFQGARAAKGDSVTQDISFRPALTALRAAWEAQPHASDHPAEGALLLTDYRTRRDRLPAALRQQTETTVKAIMQAVRQPVRYAGGAGPHALFGLPSPAASLAGTALPGTLASEPAFTVPLIVWDALRELSLWAEALCLHEWSLYVEKVRQEPAVGRGQVFALLTAVPEGRISLTWERHQVRLLMLEGQTFRCPWTGQTLTPQRFDLDHLIPVSALPINELWNLLPSDPAHNSM
ncbi:HNH endonuclease [Deinococcus cavernae]|uniref:HNH endonuclease n=1 Tax=Deinococcus cavernae TaxID=2320857 RepID=A0A418VHE2_9DEIO|nr:HNH endonuclease signature motif containing protein [Deinococcus cavernae]RJF75543.1 HNH endonuclease [Deinococcus cavernae]